MGQDRWLAWHRRAGAVLFAGLAQLGLLSWWVSDRIRIFKIGDKISFLVCEESTPWEYALEPQASRTVPRFS